eukprot:7382579-Prymnesium_polylepis.1
MPSSDGIASKLGSWFVHIRPFRPVDAARVRSPSKAHPGRWPLSCTPHAWSCVEVCVVHTRTPHNRASSAALFSLSAANRRSSSHTRARRRVTSEPASALVPAASTTPLDAPVSPASSTS